MTDEMILVPRAELLAWAKAWLNDYDPNDGTDCVTPFDTYLLKSPVEAQPCGCGEATCVEPWEPGCGLGKSEQHAKAKAAPYNRKRIAWELERTAMGDGYYGNALYVAKDFPEATPSVRSLLDRWATGKERGLSDRTDLCAFALQIYAADRESPQPPTDAQARCFTEEVGKDGNPTGYLLFGQSAPAGVEDKARHMLAEALRPHDPMAADWAMEPAFDGYAVAQRDALHAIAVALAQQPPAVDGPLVERIAALLHEEATDEPWAVAGVEHDGPDRDYYRTLARKVIDRAGKQPYAVDGAMVERATMALLGKTHDSAPGVDWRCDRSWTVNRVRELMRLALSAALAGKQGGVK